MADINSEEARTAVFPEARRGLEASAVNAYKVAVASSLAHLERAVTRLEAELAQAREGEEAVRRTYAAAMREKDEIVGEAETTAAELSEAARSEADEIVLAARTEAAEILKTAVADSQTAAAELVAERARLIKQYNRVRTATNDLYRRLQAVAGSSLDELAVVSGLIELEDGAAESLDGLHTPTVLDDVVESIELETTEDHADALDDPDRKTTRYERRLGGLKDRLREAKGG